ncbi:unnamed protein product, partial [Ectocarpus sp. 12 AP-2014]
REGDPPLLRQVEGAHCTDINAVAVSQRWSLIASGSADGSFRLWDFQFLSCEGSYAVGNEVLCVSFLEPYPLVAVGDAGGYVSIFLVRPWPGQGRVVGGANDIRRSALLRFSNDREAEGTIEGGSAVTCLTHRRISDASSGGIVGDVDGEGGGGDIGDDEAASGHLLAENMVLYTGDDKGTVRAWEIGESLLARVGGPVVPEHVLPRSQSNYDPRRRFNKQYVEPPSTDRESLEADGHHLITPRSLPEAESDLPLGSDRNSKATRVGILQDPDGETTRPKQQQASAKILIGGSTGCVRGPELIGQWAPHLEAVVSLQVLEDPPCLLTGSRDRSVKLWSLPAKYRRRISKPSASDGPTARARRTVEQDKEDSSNSSRKGGGDSVSAAPPSPTTPAPLSGRQWENEQPANSTGKISSPSTLSTQSSTVASAAPAKIPRHGHDLSTLTMGRIADGFRRAEYVFPVDHKGRGEGRAIEARAVLQAIEEIELRKEKRKQEEAALDRARGGAAAAAAAAVAKAKPTAAVPTPPTPPTTTGKAAAAQTSGLQTTGLMPPTTPRTSTTPPDTFQNTSDAAAQPQYTGASRNVGEHDRNLPLEPGDSRVGARASTAEQQRQQRVPLGSLSASPPPPEPTLAAHGGDATAAADSAAAAPRVGGAGVSADPAAAETAAAAAASFQGQQQRERSAAAVHKASSAFGIRKTASAMRLTEQNKPPLAGGARQRRLDIRGGGIATAGKDGNTNNKGHGMYENMAVEELRLKNLEASSKAAARCAREAVTIREMLQPSAFLLSQMPDVLSSYPSITTILTKHGDMPAAAGTLDDHPRGADRLSEHSSETGETGHGGAASGGAVGRRKKHHASSASTSSLRLSTSTEDSRSSTYSFNCPQEQPSVLDYSQQGMDTVPDTFLPRGFASRDSKDFGHGSGLESYAGGKPRDSQGDSCREDRATATKTEVCDNIRPVPAAVEKEEAAKLRAGDEENDGSPLAGSSLGGKRDGVAMITGVPHSEGGWGGKHYKLHGKEPRSTDQQQGKGGGKNEGVVTAKVKTKRSPRRPVPGYLSACRDGLGAASRWGALSKAHLEFHRLGTAGILSSLSCPSLERRLGEASSWMHGAPACRNRLPEAGATTGLSAREHQDVNRPFCAPLLPVDLDSLAQRHGQAQMEWKQRVESFAAKTTSKKNLNTNHKTTRAHLKKIGKTMSSGNSGLQSLAAAPLQEGVSEAAKKAGKRPLPGATGKKNQGWWSSAPLTTGQNGRTMDHEGQRDLDDERGKEILRAKTQFGPYHRQARSTFEMMSLWKAFDLAKAFGRRVDARLLFRNPFLRDNNRYRKHILEMLCDTRHTGPILVTREDALMKLLPLLERPEAKAFLACMKLMEADKRDSATNNDAHEDREIDQETLRELRKLFDLYDVDRSGVVDVKEIAGALKENYSTAQISAGMGDAVTEGELANLLSSLSPDTRGDAAGHASASGTTDTCTNPAGVGSSPEADFDDFVRLFRGVF